ncbi:MAG: PKD domain-containing protein [Candidatus Buchananbacteria bacterium]|nr:PKD domain-containing protein [Candidatus Buchananbacteria bacterium]
MKKIIFLIIFGLSLPFTLMAADNFYDLGITAGDISFSDELIAGQNVKIYASVRNLGNADVSGYVTFHKSDTLIGDSQVVSVKASSLADEVFVDFTVPIGSFNIRAEIKGQTPIDENPNNDIAVTTLFVPKLDNDGDGIPDDEDKDDDNDGVIDENEPVFGTDPNDLDSDDDGCLDGDDDFPTNPDECSDNDGDGIGDNQDNDDDNDGLSDNYENQINTDPLDADTDDDGVIDGQDYCPGDPACTEEQTETDQDNDNNESDDEQNTDEAPSNLPEGNEAVDDEDKNKDIDINDIDEQLKPKVKIKTEKKEWDTYVFSADLKGVLDENLVYNWDFGDGTSSDQKVVEHQYEEEGQYDVNLTVTGPDDLELIDNKKINISFFNFGNKGLILSLGGLAVLLAILFRLSFCGIKLR